MNNLVRCYMLFWFLSLANVFSEVLTPQLLVYLADGDFKLVGQIKNDTEVSFDVEGVLKVYPNRFEFSRLADPNRRVRAYTEPSGVGGFALRVAPQDVLHWHMEKEEFDESHYKVATHDRRLRKELRSGGYQLYRWGIQRGNASQPILVGFLGNRSQFQKPVVDPKSENAELWLGFLYKPETELMLTFLVLNGENQSVEVGNPFSAESSLRIYTPDQQFKRELKIGNLDQERVTVAANGTMEWLYPWKDVQQLLTEEDKASVRKAGGVYHLVWVSGEHTSRPLPILLDEPKPNPAPPSREKNEKHD